MYYAVDKQIARRAVMELRAARADEHATALACLQRLRNEVAGASPNDHQRLAAWVAIRKLYEAMRSAPERDLKELWQEAIARTDFWAGSLR